MNPLTLLASAIAGRPVEVATATPGERGWTDGQTVYLEQLAGRRDRLVQLAVQASLLAAGSLDAGIRRELRRDRALARRYLAIEGHRALVANEDVLPPWLHSIIDRDLASRARAPAEALELARRERKLEPPPAFGTIDVRRWSSSPAHAAPHDAPRPPGAHEAGEFPETAPAPDLTPLLSGPNGMGGPIGRLLSRLFQAGRTREAAGASAATGPTQTGRGRSGAGPELISPVPATPALDAALPRPVIRRYPEWDCHRRAYRADWCHVIEDVASSGPETAEPFDTHGLHAALARLGTALTPWRRRPHGDDVDLDAMVERSVSLATGTPPTADVYIERLRRRRDLSVLILLDVSGSAAEPGTGGRSVHEHQRDAAAGLLAALHGLGDRVALYAFSSSGRTAVHVSRVKAFDERLDRRVWQRLGALEPGGYTRLGAAIRHGTTVLAAAGGTSSRLLVVMSDGLAYDHGYEGRYGEADARHALLEARRRGIGCACLSVGAAGEVTSLQRVFGAASHAVVKDVRRLTTVVGPLFRAALRSAELSRRSAQRHLRDHMVVSP